MTEQELRALVIAHEFATAVEQWKALSLPDLDDTIKAGLLVLRVSKRDKELEKKIEGLCSVLGVPRVTYFLMPDNGRMLVPPIW